VFGSGQKYFLGKLKFYFPLFGSKKSENIFSNENHFPLIRENNFQLSY